MIFPPHCKFVGVANGTPCGRDKAYFLTRYIVRETPDGTEVIEIKTDPEESGLLRTVVSTRLLAAGDEVYHYPEPVNVQDRTFLVTEAMRSGYRCTIFSGYGEQTTFVIDPDLSGFLRIHVYDITPPRPHLSATLTDLERTGVFGDLEVVFEHHVRDIKEIGADVYPCRAAGFPRTIDADRLRPGDRVAACMTGRELIKECYGDSVTVVDNICPLEAVKAEPFIARCCRSERAGVGLRNGLLGAVVHWGASAWDMVEAVRLVATTWRRGDDRGSDC